jgi:hypothetical protein
MRKSFPLFAALIVAAGVMAAPAAAGVPHSLKMSGPGSGKAGQPMVLKAAGTVSDDPSVFLERYVTAYAIPASVVSSCPATFQGALQIKDSTSGIGGETVALGVPVEGSFSVPIAYTPSRAGRFLLCGYLNELVGTDARATHVVDVAGAAGGNSGAKATKPAVVKRPKLKRKGKKLVCGRGSWSGRPDGYTYRWWVNGKRKAGAAKRTLKITRKVRGRKVRCAVRARNQAGATLARSKTVKVR